MKKSTTIRGLMVAAVCASGLALPNPAAHAETAPRPASQPEQPQVSSRLGDCNCVELLIEPSGDPVAKGERDAGTPSNFNVTIEVTWAQKLTCLGDGDTCKGDHEVKASSTKDWKVDHKPAGKEKDGEATTESVTVGGKNPAKSECVGLCDGIPSTTKFTSSYTATVTNQSGGHVTKAVSGIVTLEAIASGPGLNCLKVNSWKMTLVYSATVKNAKGGGVTVTPAIDKANSDYDGDGVRNGRDKHPLDPTRH